MASEKAIKSVPQSFKAGPYRYDVGFDGEAAYDYDCFGVCLYRSRRVKLDPRQADTELAQTMIHEVLHAIGNAYEITEWDRHKMDNDGRVIDKIDLMGKALLTFIRENLELIEWLQKTR